MRTHVTFICVNKIEAMYGRSPVNVKVERKNYATVQIKLKFHLQCSGRVTAYHLRQINIAEVLFTLHVVNSFHFGKPTFIRHMNGP